MGVFLMTTDWACPWGYAFVDYPHVEQVFDFLLYKVMMFKH